jgi:F-type H+-transporting ATPase subunit gamma
MPTLKEIKGRISSVKSTLKITAAMKLVSSAKLRKAQKATEAMRPYEARLQRMLSLVQGPSAGWDGFSVAKEKADAPENPSASLPAAIVAVASNSSLCGGFNANVVAKVRSVRQAGDVVYSVGRKMADAMRKDGFPSPEDFTALADHPTYAPAAALVEKLMDDVHDGKFSKVVLVYTHFVSTAKQVPTVEELAPSTGWDAFSVAKKRADVPENASASLSSGDIILEPSRKELLEALEPKLLKLKLYAALLDSAAAEHAARTVAMQTATDNGENLLQELTLQYNKGRQQKITSEILDLAGGQMQE